jgi:hypothetical protein
LDSNLPQGPAVHFNASLIRHSVQVARRNWKNWRDVFEHGTFFATNPLLSDQQRFGSFCREYGVARTILHGTQNELRLELLESRKFSGAILDDSGHAIDELEESLRARFGTRDGTRAMISLLSKVAAFVRPERFVAWDKYAKKGLNIVLGMRASVPFQTYSDYLAAFEEVWKGSQGQLIRKFVVTAKQSLSVESEPRFLRRV